MVIKVYISGISGNKEVKKRQQRVLLILDSKNIKYEVIDIAEPENEEKKDFMQNNSKSSGATISDPTPRHPLPPQIFSDDDYCGDYDQFDMANEVDEMEKFLKLAPGDALIITPSTASVKLGNGEILNDAEKSNETKEEEETEPKEENNVSDNTESKGKHEGEKVEQQENQEETEEGVEEE